MRKWFTWCLLTAVAFVGSGCSDDDDGGQVKLAFSKRTAVFGAGGGAVSINVDAAGAWSAAQPEAGWLEVEYDATSMRLHAEAKTMQAFALTPLPLRNRPLPTEKTAR